MFHPSNTQVEKKKLPSWMTNPEEKKELIDYFGEINNYYSLKSYYSVAFFDDAENKVNKTINNLDYLISTYDEMLKVRMKI